MTVTSSQTWEPSSPLPDEQIEASWPDVWWAPTDRAESRLLPFVVVNHRSVPAQGDPAAERDTVIPPECST